MDSIKPNLFVEFASLGEQEKSKGELQQEALSYLSQIEGWGHVKKYIEAIVADLDSSVIEAMSKGASYEDIGRKTAVKEVTKDVLNRIVRLVDGAREATERAKEPREE